jgi:hypothetical protein
MSILLGFSVATMNGIYILCAAVYILGFMREDIEDKDLWIVLCGPVVYGIGASALSWVSNGGGFLLTLGYLGLLLLLGFVMSPFVSVIFEIIIGVLALTVMLIISVLLFPFVLISYLRRNKPAPYYDM